MEIVFVLLLIIGVLIGANVWIWQLARQERAQLAEQTQRTNEAQARERALLYSILDALPDAVFSIDEQGRYTISNKAHHRLVGDNTNTEVVGKTPYDFFPEETAKRLLAEDLAIFHIQKNMQYELPYYTDDHPPMWQRILKIPVRDADRKVVGMLGVVRDITENRRMQDALRSRVDQLALLSEIDHEISATLDIHRVANTALDIILRLSRGHAGFIALQRDDQMRVFSVKGDYPADIESDTITEANGISGRVIRDHQAYLVLNVHEEPDYQEDIPSTKALMALPLINHDKLVGLISLETDRPEYFTQTIFEFVKLVAARVAIAVDNARLYQVVSDQLRNTERLYVQTQKLYQEKSVLEQLKTDMIRIASHDLKNPLSVVQGYITLLLSDDTLQDFHVGILQDVQKSTNRMFNMLDSILSLERLNHSTAQSYTEFDIQSDVQQAYDEFLTQAKSKEQTLNLHCVFQSAPIVNGDRVQLYEAITNLIGNAIKYTPVGGQVDIFMEVPAKDHFVFRVKDNGYGIPQDLQPHLFQPFFRAKTAETRTIEGTGLGLHLVKNIVDRHHGTMLFESEYGKGSMFGFVLPLSLHELLES